MLKFDKKKMNEVIDSLTKLMDKNGLSELELSDDKFCVKLKKKIADIKKINLPEVSMGMTNDYLDALEYKSTYLRIGTGIFGKRTK